MTSHGGPLTLVDGELSADDLQLAARIVARYSQGRMEPEVEMEYIETSGHVQPLKVVPLGPTDVKPEWML